MTKKEYISRMGEDKFKLLEIIAINAYDAACFRSCTAKIYSTESTKELIDTNISFKDLIDAKVANEDEVWFSMPYVQGILKELKKYKIIKDFKLVMPHKTDCDKIIFEGKEYWDNDENIPGLTNKTLGHITIKGDFIRKEFEEIQKIFNKEKNLNELLDKIEARQKRYYNIETN